MPASSTPFKVTFALLVTQSFVASAAFQLSPTSEVFLNSTVAVRYDDNIFQTESGEVDDVIFQFSPGVELKAGKQETSAASVRFTQDFLVYSDNDDRNASLSNIAANASIRTARSSLRVNANYQQLEGNTQDFLGSRFGDLVKRENYGAGLRTETSLTPKINASAGINARRTDYDSDIFADNTSTAIPLNVYYRMSQKLELSTGYEWRDTSLGETVFPAPSLVDPNAVVTVRNAGSYSHFFNVGARGELAPKLTANFRVGAEARESRRETVEDKTTLAVDGTFTWAASPKSTYGLVVGRRFDTSGSGDGYTRSNIALTSAYQFTTELLANAEVRYERSEYSVVDRDDDYYEFSLGGSYVLNKYLTLSAGYIFRFNSSTSSDIEFSNNVASISAAFRY